MPMKMNLSFAPQNLKHCLGNLDNSEERLILLGKKQEADLTICFEDLELAKNRQKELQNQLIGLNESFVWGILLGIY
jgi:hypothetical protein